MIISLFSLAIKNLGRRKLRSWLTLLGIMIGIAAVISLISLGQGMQEAIKSEFFQLGIDKVTIKTKSPMTGPPGTNTDITLTENDLRAVKKAKGVILVAGRVIEPVSIRFNDETKFRFGGSIPEDPEEAKMVYESLNMKIAEGRLIEKGDKYKVIISEEYKKPVFNNKGLTLRDKILINDKPFEIVGFLKKTGNPIVDKSVFMPEDSLREISGNQDRYGIIVAKIEDPDQMKEITENIAKELRKERGVDKGEEDFDITTSEDIRATFNSILSIVQAVLAGIAAISLLVGGVGIANTMYTSVLERRREIGIMKAVGAKNKDVLLIFVIEAGLLGAAGGILGVLIGSALSKAVEIIALRKFGTTIIRAVFPWWLITGALLFGFIVGMVAGVFPAKSASSLKPVDALRE